MQVSQVSQVRTEDQVKSGYQVPKAIRVYQVSLGHQVSPDPKD